MERSNRTFLSAIAFASGCFIATAALTFRLGTVESDCYAPRTATQQRTLLNAIILNEHDCWKVLLDATLLSSIVSLLLALYQCCREKEVRWKSLAAIACMPTLGILYTLYKAPQPDNDDIAFQAVNKRIRLIARVDSRRDDKQMRLECLFLDDEYKTRLSGKSVLLLKEPDREGRLAPGKLVKCSVEVSIPERRIHKWQFDYRAYLYRQGIFAVCKANPADCMQIEQIANSNLLFDSRGRINKFWSDIRLKILDTHRKNIGPRYGDLLSALILGDRTVRLPEDLVSRFREVGLSHLLAASGFNLSIVVGGTYVLMTRLSRSPHLIMTAGLSSACIFVCLAGPSPSVVRAAIMSSLLLLARGSNRRVDAGAALGFTLWLVMIHDPLSVADVGLLLSFLATAGIIYGVTCIMPSANQHNRQFNSNTNNLAVKAWNYAANTCAVVACAQAAVLPLQLHCFWEMGLMFLPANLLVEPIVAPVTICGFISSSLALLSGLPFCQMQISWMTERLTALLDNTGAWGLEYMARMAELLASMQDNPFPISPPTPGSIILYYCSLLFLVAGKKMHGTSPLIWAVYLFCLANLFSGRVSHPENLVFLDRGGIVIIHGNDTYTAGAPGRNTMDFLRFSARRQLNTLSLPSTCLQYSMNGECAEEGKIKNGSLPSLHYHLLEKEHATRRSYKRRRFKCKKSKNSNLGIIRTNAVTIVGTFDNGAWQPIDLADGELDQIARLPCLASAREFPLSFGKLKSTPHPILIWRKGYRPKLVDISSKKLYLADSAYRGETIVGWGSLSPGEHEGASIHRRLARMISREALRPRAQSGDLFLLD